LHFDFAAQRFDIAPHHVHADAASRYVGYLVGGGQTGMKDEVVNLVVRQVFLRLD
jgi:hypothetical protein